MLVLSQLICACFVQRSGCDGSVVGFADVKGVVSGIPGQRSARGHSVVSFADVELLGSASHDEVGVMIYFMQRWCCV